MPVGSTSRLGRLFTYSKDTLLVAQENFTTEALRMAIEDDPWPMVEALCLLDRARAEACSLREFRGVRVRSQVSLPRGWLDLVIELVDSAGVMTNEVWVEVKIGAPESGGQLAHYRGQAEGRRPRPWLITLANEAIHSDVPNLSWNVLYQCARHGRQESRSWAQHPSWEDLGRFLEEQNVTRDELAPITDTEAGSLEAAHHLIGKVWAVVKAVHERLPSIFSPEVVAKVRWASVGALKNSVMVSLGNSTSMCASGFTLCWGLVAEDGSAFWAVQVDAARTAVPAAAVQHARLAAEAGGPALDEPAGRWHRPRHGNVILEARTRAGHVSGHEEAVAWITARLRELAEARVIEAFLGETSGLSEAGQSAQV